LSSRNEVFFQWFSDKTGKPLKVLKNKQKRHVGSKAFSRKQAKQHVGSETFSTKHAGRRRKAKQHKENQALASK